MSALPKRINNSKKDVVKRKLLVFMKMNPRLNQEKFIVVQIVAQEKLLLGEETLRAKLCYATLVDYSKYTLFVYFTVLQYFILQNSSLSNYKIVSRLKDVIVLLKLA